MRSTQREGRIESERAKTGRESQAGNLQGIILLAEGVDEKIVADSGGEKRQKNEMTLFCILFIGCYLWFAAAGKRGGKEMRKERRTGATQAIAILLSERKRN